MTFDDDTAGRVEGAGTGVGTRAVSVEARVAETGARVGVGFGARGWTTGTPTAGVPIGFEVVLGNDSSVCTGDLTAVPEPGNRNVKELVTLSCIDFVAERSADNCGAVVVGPDDVPGTFSLILPGVFVYLGRACGGGRSDISWRK